MKKFAPWQWPVLILGTGIISWSLLTAGHSRTFQALSTIVGGVVVCVGLNPDRKPDHEE